MSDFSLALVLHLKTSEIINDMAPSTTTVVLEFFHGSTGVPPWRDWLKSVERVAGLQMSVAYNSSIKSWDYLGLSEPRFPRFWQRRQADVRPFWWGISAVRRIF